MIENSAVTRETYGDPATMLQQVALKASDGFMLATEFHSSGQRVCVWRRDSFITDLEVEVVPVEGTAIDDVVYDQNSNDKELVYSYPFTFTAAEDVGGVVTYTTYVILYFGKRSVAWSAT